APLEIVLVDGGVRDVGVLERVARPSLILRVEPGVIDRDPRGPELVARNRWGRGRNEGKRIVSRELRRRVRRQALPDHRPYRERVLPDRERALGRVGMRTRLFGAQR